MQKRTSSPVLLFIQNRCAESAQRERPELQAGDSRYQRPSKRRKASRKDSPKKERKGVTTRPVADGGTGGSASIHAPVGMDAFEDACRSNDGGDVADAAGGSSQKGAIDDDASAGTGGVGGGSSAVGDADVKRQVSRRESLFALSSGY